MANFSGRLALHGQKPASPRGDELGHFSSSLNDVRTASLSRSPTSA